MAGNAPTNVLNAATDALDAPQPLSHYKLDADAIRKLHPREFYQRFLREGLRPDGRTPEKTRKLVFNGGSISTADGSALVKLGETVVVCGVKLEVAEPRLHEPNRGYLIPNVDLSCLCSPQIRPGPPTDEAQAFTARLDRLFRECNMLDLSRLCIVEGKHVWAVYVHVTCLNAAGNVWDSVVLAATMALASVRLPPLLPSTTTNSVAENGGFSLGSELHVDPNSQDPSTWQPLPLECAPVALTFALMEGQQVQVGVVPEAESEREQVPAQALVWVADPTVEEEQLQVASLSITVDALQQPPTLLSIYKPGGSAIARSSLRQCIAQARAQCALWFHKASSS